ncbi:MAG: sigma-70 family RNA polymerase sigma factor [Planctomycetes bacterium]|nr:sigma-70 family RNA polymerase sigma factor [Planctomycetota bacterium]MCC7170995.1 sigma-70 family RNA polymerase sigma factor [Planctomycetota bacterium]
MGTMSSHPSPTLELLLRHRSLVRAIARDLLVDPDAADDVVQQTWLAALRHADRGAALERGLLARIAMRLAFNRRREGLRRTLRERAAATPEPTTDVARLVEQEEQRRRVVDAVFALDEPLRTTVLRRYFDELTEAEVAHSLGVPLGTVRTRLRRARALLRERLERDGDAPGPARALIALAGWSADEAAAAIAAGKGILAMTAKTWGVVAASLVLVGVCMWTITDPTPDPHDGVGSAKATAADDDPRRHATDDDSSNEARALDVAADPTRTAVESNARRVSPTIVTGRCVNSARAPLAGVTVKCSMAPAPAITDAAGRFELALEPDEPVRPTLRVSLDGSGSGHASQDREYVVVTATTNEIGDLALVGSGSIRGVVRDERGDGRAATVIDVIPGDPLVVLKKEAAPIANFTVVDDATNEPCRGVWVRLSEELRRPDPFESRRSSPNEDELRRAGEEALERAKRSREAPRDRPIGKMMPPPSTVRHWLGRTDAQGFASAPMPPNPLMVRIEIDAYEPFEAGPFDVHGSPPPTTIRLVPRRSLALRGRVTIDGAPANDASVRVDEGTSVDRRTVSRASTSADGGFIVRPKPGVAPDAPLELRASAPGRADATIEFPTLDAAREASAVGTPALELPVGGAIAGTGLESSNGWVSSKSKFTIL